VSIRHLLHVVGAVIGAAGIAMLSAAAVAAIYREWAELGWIVASAAVTVAIGFGLWKVFDRPGELTTREGFAAVGLSWMSMCLFGALPYVLSGAIPGITDAVFESTAGFTTTGSSILADPSALSNGILFWRSLTQWIGGMGIIVLSVAILPLLGMGAVQLARAESPGPTPDRLTPRFADTAKRLWLVYAALTLVEVILLWAGEMNLFEAVNHAFTTMSTGGFSTEGGSMGAFGPYSQWIVIVFMFLAGASFSLHYKAIREPLAYLRSAEFKLYGTIVLVAAAAIGVATWGGSLEGAARDGLFTSLTLVTTTGYGTVDFGLWGPALQIGVIGLMFVGGMAGSTSGSIKVYRLDVLYNASRMDVRRLIHPRGVFVTRIGKNPVPDAVVEATQTFFLLYMFAFMTGTFLLAIIESLAGAEISVLTTVSAVATTLGNVGPGLDAVGPTQNFIPIPALGKWLLSALMVIGRLEILPILILFNRELWKR
jgi:trk system potassium uptake protein TrkH